jgi:hypothetical protein
VTDIDDDDWRLEATLDKGADGEKLDRVIEAARNAPEDQRPSEDVVITHDGKKLFAYATGREQLDRARSTLETALAGEQLESTIVVSTWDEKLELWRQVEPAPSEDSEESFEAAEREADEQTTQTLVASVGRFVREEFEQIMVDAAGRLELAYKYVEHPHLLTTQVAFTVTGPRHAVAEFEREMRATARATVRAQEEIGFSL